MSSLAPRQPVCRRSAGSRDLLALAAAWPARYPGLLESAAPGSSARWDILFALPEATLSWSPGDLVRDATGVARGERFLDVLDSAWRAAGDARAGADVADLPFTGGWLLYLGYELAGQIEPAAASRHATGARVPSALALRCPAAILVDRHADVTWLVAEPGRAALLDVLQADLDALATAAPAIAATHRLLALREDEPQVFFDGVARVHGYLRAGDTFQVNLSRGWQAEFAQAVAPVAVYAALRRANPAPYAGLLQQPGWAIASSSPERLLEIRAGVAQTRPIAGTRPRGAAAEDGQRAAELLGHAKERAEHVMLVDLERNDLGRVCVPGSVRVDELMALESYAHVHHIVSNVRGRLREEASPAQAIAAMFPGGTITGCPKVRCMQIIAELEGQARGVYTGSLGYLTHAGNLDLNILIRSMLIDGAQVSFRAGAGIVADSEAAFELAETRAKAQGMLRALATLQT